MKMSEKENLFQIGVLSKLTGVHIRCLRYYEKLGILTPAYIDEETSYRYYNYRQMRIVEAIQYCVELDIPLKDFKDFLSENEEQIDYEALISYGKKITDEKMKKILERQHFVEDMKNAMAHAERCYENRNIIEYYQGKYLYCLPYEGTCRDGGFQNGLIKLIDELKKNGLSAGYDHGLLICGGKQNIKSYLFADIKETERDISHLEKAIKMPKGKYLCVAQNESGTNHMYDFLNKQTMNNENVFLIETELFSSKYPYVSPGLELRYFVGE